MPYLCFSSLKEKLNRKIVDKEILIGLIKDKQVIITTLDSIESAVMDNLSNLYIDRSDMYHDTRDFCSLTDKEKKDIADDIIDYINDY